MESFILGGTLLVSSPTLAGLWYGAALDGVQLGVILGALASARERSEYQEQAFLVTLCAAEGMAVGVLEEDSSSLIRVLGPLRSLEVRLGFFLQLSMRLRICWAVFRSPEITGST